MPGHCSLLVRWSFAWVRLPYSSEFAPRPGNVEVGKAAYLRLSWSPGSHPSLCSGLGDTAGQFLLVSDSALWAAAIVTRRAIGEQAVNIGRHSGAWGTPSCACNGRRVLLCYVPSWRDIFMGVQTAAGGRVGLQARKTE